MRPLKFRAWDGKRYYSMKEMEEFKIGDISGCFWESVEQSTAMYDKNGREIYEGDILHDLVCVSKWEVVWNQDVPSFEERSIRNPVQRYIMAKGHTNTMEVIGNIHENPDLLK